MTHGQPMGLEGYGGPAQDPWPTIAVGGIVLGLAPWPAQGLEGVCGCGGGVGLRVD